MNGCRRPGFTLVETIVALVLLQIGMLALAATTGVAARDLTDALVRRRAQVIARSRADWFRGTACGAGSAGTRMLNNGMREYWRVETSGPTRTVIDSVSAPLTRGGHAAVVARASVLCAT